MEQPIQASEESGSRARTRYAILDSAVTVLARNPRASLADVAAEARVGRTTVHRYFPERADLVAALTRHVLEGIAAATRRARLDQGPALGALERLCQEYFALGESLSLLFKDPQMWEGVEGWDAGSEGEGELVRLVERGHRDGSIDSELDARWVQQILWSLLYAAWQYAEEQGGPRYQVLRQCLRTLTKAVGA
ncbi:helix-turn-helix domain-containing protein [Streptomyces sp. NPDC005438]|uniref:TetR/AcrR family transcriptional regulator n=1 Tax=Streptomyces sp. NPDC005438 TaxID=3156880 RepID=UPI0033ADD8E9